MHLTSCNCFRVFVPVASLVTNSGIAPDAASDDEVQLCTLVYLGPSVPCDELVRAMDLGTSLLESFQKVNASSIRSSFTAVFDVSTFLTSLFVSASLYVPKLRRICADDFGPPALCHMAGWHEGGPLGGYPLVVWLPAGKPSRFRRLPGAASSNHRCPSFQHNRGRCYHDQELHNHYNRRDDYGGRGVGEGGFWGTHGFQLPCGRRYRPRRGVHCCLSLSLSCILVCTKLSNIKRLSTAHINEF